MAKLLIQQGFEPVAFSTESVPDIAVAIIVKYYAWMAGDYCNDYAKSMDLALSAVGIRTMIQKTVGIPEVKVETRFETFDECLIRQMPQIAAKWEVKFEKEFWAGLENTYGLVQKQRVCSMFIATYIYGYFPPELRDRLDEINPVKESGYRKNKQHQHFDGNLLEMLQRHIRVVTLNLIKANSKAEFKTLMRKVPKFNFEVLKMLPGDLN